MHDNLRSWNVLFCFSLAFLVMFACTSWNHAKRIELTSKVEKRPIHRSVVCIFGNRTDIKGSKIGNGFVVNEDGYVITTKHLLRNLAQPYRVLPFCGKNKLFFWDGSFVDTSDSHDLGLIRMKSSKKSPPFDPGHCAPCTLAHDKTVFFLGTDVEIHAYSCLEQKPIFEDGTIRSSTKDVIEINDNMLYEGCSGSPVFFRSSNSVIGCQVSGFEMTIPKDTVKIANGKAVVEYVPTGIILAPYEAIPVKCIKDFLTKNSVTPYEGHFELQSSPTYRGNPHPEKDHKEEHLAMLNLILSFIEDIIMEYNQFEGNLDADILLETYYEASSFKKKLLQAKYDRTTARENAEFFFIKGLTMKATRPRGVQTGVEYFARAAYEDSTFADPHYQIALYHLRCTGDSTKIIEHINKGLAYDSTNGELLRTLAMFYLHCNNYDSARVYLAKAAKYLSKGDPRTPFYMGLTFDPYWRMIRPLQSWTDSFIQVGNRQPTFPEIQEQKEKLLFEMPDWQDNISKAFSFFDSSRNLAPGYIKPLNSEVWILTNEVLRGEPTYVQLLKELLQQMEQFVGYGLSDPRFLNTLALGYAALRDCETARKYLNLSMERAKTLGLSSRYQKDLELENQRVARMCELFITPYQRR